MKQTRAEAPSAMSFAGRILEAARETGIDVAPLLAIEADAPTPDLTLPTHLRRVREFWSTLMRTARSPGLPVRVARRCSIDDCSVLGLAAKTAPDLRAALQRLVQYQWIWTGTPEMLVTEDRERRVARVEIPPLEGFGLGGRCRREMIVANVLQFSREMAGPDLRARCVHFGHRAPASTDEHAAFFASELRFDSGYTGLELDLATLDRPLVHADAGLSGFLLEYLESLAADRRRPDAAAVEDRVRRAIRERLAHGPPDMEEIAAQLGTSTRSLRRHLVARGTRYRDLLDAARRELAEAELASRDETVAEIAARVGFSEPSALYRAFRRWTGGQRVGARRPRERGAWPDRPNKSARTRPLPA